MMTLNALYAHVLKNVFEAMGHLFSFPDFSATFFLFNQTGMPVFVPVREGRPSK